MHAPHGRPAPAAELPAATWFRERVSARRWLLLVPESVAAGEPVMVEDRHGNREPKVAGADVGGVFVAQYGPHAGKRVRLVEPIDPDEDAAAQADAAADNEGEGTP